MPSPSRPTTPSVPRAHEFTGHKSPADLAAEREWADAAKRRRDLAAQCQRARAADHPVGYNSAWKRMARETRSR